VITFGGGATGVISGRTSGVNNSSEGVASSLSSSSLWESKNAEISMITGVSSS